MRGQIQRWPVGLRRRGKATLPQILDGFFLTPADRGGYFASRAHKGTHRPLAVLKFCNFPSFGAALTVREWCAS